jgi:hypothetical protein
LVAASDRGTSDSLGAIGLTDEREAFETWASDPIRAEKLPLDRWPTNNGYKDPRTYVAFYAWKAGRAALSAPPEGMRLEQEESWVRMCVFPSIEALYLVRYKTDGGFDLMTKDAIYENQHDLDAWYSCPVNLLSAAPLSSTDTPEGKQ